MKRLNLICCLLALAMTNTVHAAKDNVVPNDKLNAAFHYGPPPLRKLIGAHLDVFPGSFPHRDIIYMPYLDHMSYLQGELVRKLLAIPKYREETAKRGPMLDITIKATKEYELMAKVFDRSYLDRYQAEMAGMVKEVTAEKVQKRLSKYLAGAYPEYRERREASWFWAGSDRNRAVETSIVAQVLMYGLTQKGTELNKLNDIRLEEGHIDYLLEEELWHAALEPTANRLDEKHRKIFFEQAEEVLQRWSAKLRNEEYSSTPKVLTVKAGDVIRLQEVHPDLAVLRGFVGNDCSTDVSFGFPYSPYERTYYVTNEKNEFLGYVSLSLVDFRKERSFFFHTIAGPEINHAMNDMIIRGVYAAREQIGGKYMAMPENHRIEENINFSPIEQMMKKYAAPGRLEEVTWLDREYRWVIMDTGSRAFYDDPERNKLGRLIETDASDLEVTVQRKPFQSPFGLLNVGNSCAGDVAAGGT